MVFFWKFGFLTFFKKKFSKLCRTAIKIYFSLCKTFWTWELSGSQTQNHNSLPQNSTIFRLRRKNKTEEICSIAQVCENLYCWRSSRRQMKFSWAIVLRALYLQPIYRYLMKSCAKPFLSVARLMRARMMDFRSHASYR